MRPFTSLGCASLFLFVAAGCSQSADSAASAASAESASTAHPEAVLVDFFIGTQRTGACTGTLIAPRVVLTAAHCADAGTAAYVRAPNAQGQSSDASQILKYYDWSKTQTGAARAQNHDLALVMLKQAIVLTDYARVQQNACAGCDVVSVTRQGKSLSMTGGMRTSNTAVTSHPSSVLVSQGSSDAGGAVIRTVSGHPYVVGVMTGRGKATGVGFATRLDEHKVQTWISHVVALTRDVPTTGIGGATTRSLRPSSFGDSDGTPAAPAVTNPVVAGPASDALQGPDSSTTDEEDEGGKPDDADDPAEPGPHDGPSHNAGGEYAEDNINVWNEDQNDLVVENGSNYWMGLPTDDATDDPETPDELSLGGNDRVFFMMAGDSAFFIDSHGDEDGAIESLPTKDDVQAAVAAMKPIVLVVCFAGKDDTYGEGTSLASRLASSWGADPSNVYGCTGSVGSSGDCDGEWVNAKGDRLPATATDTDGVSSVTIPGVTGVTFTNEPGKFSMPDMPDDAVPPPPPMPPGMRRIVPGQSVRTYMRSDSGRSAVVHN